MNQIIVETILLLLPAGAANVAPVIAAQAKTLQFLRIPLDGGKTIRGKRLLGNNKTVLGLVAGILFGSIAGIILHFLEFGDFNQLYPFYRPLSWGATFGGLLGLGALAGDAAKSFLKRQLNIAPGKSLPIIDQCDFVIGALIVAGIFFPLLPQHVVAGIVIFGLLSFVSSFIGMKLKMKKSL